MMKYSTGGIHYVRGNFKAGVGGCFIHNVLHTKNEPIPDGYDSFLDYWEKKSGKKLPLECRAISPHKKDDGTDADKMELVGAHVRIDGEGCAKDEAWIVPLCKNCNNDSRTWCIYMPEGMVFVPIKMTREHTTASNNLDPWIKLCWRMNG